MNLQRACAVRSGMLPLVGNRGLVDRGPDALADLGALSVVAGRADACRPKRWPDTNGEEPGTVMMPAPA